jgi:HAE1 family hydrophobic/amphiphilic exporter-1
MLIGIVVTNAIVLLDLVERLRAKGMSTTDALIEGGRTRVRPILMTAIATILALIPLAAGFNQGSIIAAELGTVVIGGLFSSTFLTLLVVPVIYSIVDSVRSFRYRRGTSADAVAR